MHLHQFLVQIVPIFIIIYFSDANTRIVHFTGSAEAPFGFGDAITVSVQFSGGSGMAATGDRLWTTLVFEYDLDTLGY